MQSIETAMKSIFIVGVLLLSYTTAQDYSGRYVGADEGGNKKVLELESDGSVYSGIIGFGVEFGYAEAELIDGMLVGFYSLDGETVEAYFTALKEEDFIIVYIGALSANGTIEEDDMIQWLLQKESVTTNPTTTPLVSPQQTVKLLGQDIQFGVQYSGGTLLKSDFVGVSFSIPTNGQAFYSPEQGFTFGHRAIMSGAVQLIALSSGNLSAIITDILSVDDDMQLIPLEEIVDTETYIKAKFQLLTEDIVAYKEIRATQGEAGQIVILLGTGFLQEAEQVSIAMDEIEASFRYGTPKLDEVRQLAASFSGVQFSASSGGSQAPGVISGSSFTLDLCSSQEFRLFEDSVFSIGVNDPSGDFVGGGRAESEEESFGNWELGATLAGPAILLQKQNGGFDFFEMFEQQGNIFLNAKPVLHSPSQICN